MARDKAMAGRERLMRSALPRVVLLAMLVATACGEAPLESVGWRSSDWINEPTVPTTVAVKTTTPTVIPSERLRWANDQIENENLNDRDAALRVVFGRREGDRFIQASRFEITTALPELVFPSIAPSGAEWVSSQLVFNNDGTLADDPSAAFGLWSAEPYTRSRSVAQMVVLRVSLDPIVAEEVATAESEPSCDRFADRAAEGCEVRAVGDRPTWLFSASNGSTLVWFQEEYRYELFGRSFVGLSILEDMTTGMVRLAELVVESS